MRRVLMLAVLLLLTIAACRPSDVQLRKDAALLRAVDSLTVEVSAARRQADSVTKAFRADTVRLTTSVTKWRTVRDTVRVLLRDTVRVPSVIVRELVASSDSAITRCEATVSTCAAALAEKDSVIATERALRKAEDKRRPNWFARARSTAKTLATGAVLGAAAVVVLVAR